MVKSVSLHKTSTDCLFAHVRSCRERMQTLGEKNQSCNTTNFSVDAGRKKRVASSSDSRSCAGAHVIRPTRSLGPDESILKIPRQSNLWLQCPLPLLLEPNITITDSVVVCSTRSTKFEKLVICGPSPPKHTLTCIIAWYPIPSSSINPLTHPILSLVDAERLTTSAEGRTYRASRQRFSQPFVDQSIGQHSVFF